MLKVLARKALGSAKRSCRIFADTLLHHFLLHNATNGLRWTRSMIDFSPATAYQLSAYLVDLP